MTPQLGRSVRIDNAIDRWHMAPVEDPDDECVDIPLHKFLGWTWDEYRAYTERGVIPPEREGAI